MWITEGVCMNWMTELDLFRTEQEIKIPVKKKLPWWKQLESIFNCEQQEENGFSDEVEEINKSKKNETIQSKLADL